MIKVNGKTYDNNASTYDLDTLYLDKARESYKIVCNDDLRDDFEDNVSWSIVENEEEKDMSDYCKCVFKGYDCLLKSYLVVMSKSTQEEDLQEIIDALS